MLKFAVNFGKNGIDAQFFGRIDRNVERFNELFFDDRRLEKGKKQYPEFTERSEKTGFRPERVGRRRYSVFDHEAV